MTDLYSHSMAEDIESRNYVKYILEEYPLDEIFIKVNYVIAIFGILYSFYSIYLVYTTSNYIYSLLGVFLGFYIATIIGDRNVYYKRYKSLVKIIVEEDIPIGSKNHTEYVYDRKIISPSDDYVEISEDKVGEVDVTIKREYFN